VRAGSGLETVCGRADRRECAHDLSDYLDRGDQRPVASWAPITRWHDRVCEVARLLICAREVPDICQRRT